MSKSGMLLGRFDTVREKLKRCSNMVVLDSITNMPSCFQPADYNTYVVTSEDKNSVEVKVPLNKLLLLAIDNNLNQY